MRYSKPDYYDQFQCIAGRCPATCCAGWQIVIDEDSLEKYEQEQGAFGNRLRNSIDWEEGIFYQYGQRCAFLNEENLCDLHAELGENALCDTCRKYPRHEEEFEGLREYSLSLSCPKASEIMLTNPEKVRFIQWEDEEDDDFEDFDYLMFTQLEDAREVMFSIIQNRDIDFRIRMMKIKEFGLELQQCIDEDRFFDVDEVTERYDRWSKIGWKEENTEAFLSDSEDPERKKREFSVFYQMEHLNKNWTVRLDNTYHILFDRGNTEYIKQYQDFQQQYGYESAHKQEFERLGEQLLMFFIHTYFCGAVYDDRIYSKTALSVFSVQWIQEFFMAQWLQQNGQAGMEEFLETSWSYAREVEHSDPNLELLEDWMEELLKS
ncbi:MAG: flagellin lysine-N-methylase [Eubacterium sp.]|nr:flagellin lysine-N-methylase [Eubacterium sp.]